MAHLYVRPATTSRLYQIICSKGQLSCGSCIICSLALYPDLNYLRTLITRHNKNDLYATRPRALGLTEIKMRDCNNAPLWDFVSVASR